MQIKTAISLISLAAVASLAVGLAAFAGTARDDALRGVEAGGFKFQWENYLPPNEAQVKTLLESSQAQLQSQGQILLTEAKLKTFSTNGALETLAQAPKCIFDSVQRGVRSTGRLEVQTTDGRFFLEGEGFSLWQSN